MMKIQAAVTRARHSPMQLETLELEPPRAGEVQVRIVATGICHTDIAMRDQVFPVPQPIVLGHEGAGIVEAVGPGVSKVKVGDPVIMSYDSCGTCRSCRASEPYYCYNFFERNFAGSRDDGTTALHDENGKLHSHFFGQSSFATHVICSARNVIKVPSDVPLELLGPLACGIQTGAGSVINALAVGTGQSIVVLGTGSVGLSAIMAARLVGATTIIGIDIDADRLALAKELGATHTLDGRLADLDDRVRQLTDGGVNFVVETTGQPELIKRAVAMLAPHGVCGLVGATDPAVEINLNIAHIMTAGRSVRGIIEGESLPDVFIGALIDLYRQGRFPFDRLVQFYPFEQINEAIADVESGRTIKAILRM